MVTTVYIISIGVNCFNTCQLQPDCDQELHCDNITHICYCIPNYRYLLPNGVCLQRSNVNSRCIIYKPCIDGKCTATNDIEVNFDGNSYNKLIVRKALLNFIIKRQKNNILGFCECDKERDGNSDRGSNDGYRQQCNYKVIGRHCTVDEHCAKFVTNSQCKDNVCICNDTYYHLDDSCIQKKSLDDFCSDNTQCISNLYCRNFVCKCRKNYFYDVYSRTCLYRSGSEASETTSPTYSDTIWDNVAKVSGFVIFAIVMLFLCTRKDSEVQNDVLNGSHRRRSTRASRHRSSSINSHRPLTQTSSNASRSSAYRTFEEPVPIRQTIIMPSPAQLVSSLSSSSDEVEYNPYQFDTLFPQQSDIDDPPSYEEVVKDVRH
ncbi:uncharacterized protein LOC128961233 [Oppia nitens]|uniref:uncharacterized protein LOC128961233 n=1 Tax=Oppia nitens TaxID=1686743 RepID=UPI0023DCCD35|nr:uncharacterized protein LOC128961233 [Oppia nitens]